MAPTGDKEKGNRELSNKAIGENLGSQYTEAADDDERSARAREAAMLYSVAEGHLDDEAADEALATIKDSSAIFREIGDAHGLADSLRLQTKCHKARADREREQGKGRVEEKLLIDAEEQMRGELGFFRNSSDKRGEASMLMAVGELVAARGLGSSPKLAEALDYFLDAQDIAREIGDTKLEALTSYGRATLLHKRHRFKQAAQAAREAQKLFHSAGDTKYEGMSWFALGSAQINNGQVEDGFVSKRKALSIYKRIGLRKMEGTALCTFAECYLMEREDYALAIKAAQEANAIFKELNDQNWELQAHRLMVEGTSRMRDHNKALSLGKEALDLARSYDNIKELFKCTRSVAMVYMEAGRFDAAMDTADELFQLARDIEDPRWKGRAHIAVGEICDVQMRWDAGEDAARAAVAVFEDCYRFEEEYFQAVQFLGRVMIKKDEYEGSLFCMEIAKQVAVKSEDAYLEGAAYLGLSGSHYGLNDLEQAKKAANLAREVFAEEGYQRGEARVIKLALSDYFQEEGDPDSAIKLVSEGASLVEDIGDNKMLCQMKHRIAELQFDHGRPEQSTKAAMEALKIARMEEDKRSTCCVLFTVLLSNYTVMMDVPAADRGGKAFRQNVEKMARYAKEALGLAVKVRDPELESAANLWIARMHILQSKNKEALQAAEYCVELASHCNEMQYCMDAKLVMATAQDALGETKQAITLLKNTLQESYETGYETGVAQACALLEQILGAENAQLFLSPLVKPEDAQVRKPESKEVFRAPDPNRVRHFITETVKLMVGSTDQIDADMPVMETGVDSLASVELRTQLQQEFRVTLPSSVMFQYPTVNKLAKLLVDECTAKRIEWRS
mmetsp:Transcript_19186/g.54189  ORF Transcript_19186/g.54189 Transcript_19186/m.54189 type:complete len:848 (+) Transcript_19186:65-2608(+)